MRIAVASKSGREVDQHFGHAERFLIFEVGEEGAHELESVEVEKYCVYDPEHPTRFSLLERTVASLSGCRAVVTVMIGDAPKAVLEKAGIEALCVEGPIDQALQRARSELSEHP